MGIIRERFGFCVLADLAKFHSIDFSIVSLDAIFQFSANLLVFVVGCTTIYGSKLLIYLLLWLPARIPAWWITMMVDRPRK